jgi:hypothetical protein
MDILTKVYLIGIGLGYIIGYFVITLERNIRHLNYIDGYKDGLDLALKFRKSVSSNDKRLKS